MGPYFFLSYARVDDKDAYVRQFYEDLCAVIIEKTSGNAQVPVGFRDNSSIRIGEYWSESLARALGTCRSMVSLYSPAYFRSSWCSREAGVMMRRAGRHPGREASPLIPVLWQPVEVPQEVGHIQYLTEGFGGWYADAGLQRIVQQGRTGEEYRTAVELIAQRVIDVVREDFPLPAHPIQLAHEPLSFQPRAEPTRPGSSVRFFVAAGTRTSAPEHRRETPYYGTSGLDWNPYHPQEEYPLYQQAQRIVTAQGYGTGYQELGTGLVRQLQRAWRDDQVTILLVDAWSATAQAHRGQLQEFDRTEHPATGVLVPCHPPSERDEHALWKEVTEVFERKASRGALDAQFKLRVEADGFKHALGAMVSAAQNNLIRKRQAASGPPAGGDGAPPATRPILTGPTGGAAPARPRAQDPRSQPGASLPRWSGLRISYDPYAAGDPPGTGVGDDTGGAGDGTRHLEGPSA
ncbi:TIR-like protein FxsC [Streptomyces sp. NPDC001941]|uniref:TIR-like protein FxsC n=1 Tax=Streptomyces sp. NPDC001941 TaxID=3154659 RepID=UPI00332E97B0